MSKKNSGGRVFWIGRALATGLIIAITAPLQAAEQVVQNDVFALDFSGAIIIGDFVIGEQGGARLTSPCDGNIVAIQIPWISNSGATPQTLQDSIHVFDGASFPIPGTELLLLDAPLLTPGALNEFRFIDENNTIPINVPVTAGQQFYVTLQYGENTNIAGGDASIVRDTSGCTSGLNVLFASATWFDFCLFQIVTPGNVALRAVVDCAEPAGACCDFNAVCVDDVSEGSCENPGDTFFLGQACSGVTCPTPVGACCDGTGGCLENQTQNFCENILSRTYGGNGSACADQICDPGACCMQDGSCQDLLESVCSTMNPTNFEGPGTTCAGASCTQPTGACCIDVGGGNFVCVPDQTEANCGGDIWQGPFTTCTPDPCSCGLPGDMDDDGDIDLEDLDAFTACFGADVTISPECLCANVDSANNVIDLNDWSSLATIITGP
ncbi:MAG: hypothetical protein GXP29_01715, partial [Planctomycetes bacterium]|nr:hypothetical protein [Planctomycetota bacterium]